MKATKIPADCILSDNEMKCLETLNERQRRQFLAARAGSLGVNGVSLVCGRTGVCRDTLYRGRKELENGANDSFPKGRVRAAGGGRMPVLKKHPEYLDLFDKITEEYKAGLPQDPDTIWLTVSTPQIIRLFKEEHGIRVSRHTVSQMKKQRGFRNRSFAKSVTLKDVKDRNAQFGKIKRVRSWCESMGVPIFSIDTKKKEMLGNFKRQGRCRARAFPSPLTTTSKASQTGSSFLTEFTTSGLTRDISRWAPATTRRSLSATTSFTSGSSISNGNTRTHTPSAFSVTAAAQTPARTA